MENYLDYRMKARECFYEAGLTYSDIKEKDFYMLIAILADELEKYSILVKDPNTHGISTMKICDRNGLKCNMPIFNKNTNGKLKTAYIKVDSHYFKGREAISFNKEFIGFAGWADNTNIQPFVKAFIRFVEYLKGERGKQA